MSPAVFPMFQLKRIKRIKGHLPITSSFPQKLLKSLYQNLKAFIKLAFDTSHFGVSQKINAIPVAI